MWKLVRRKGFFLGATVFDHVKPDMTIAKEEIFGPVLSLFRAEDLDEALAISESIAIRQLGGHLYGKCESCAEISRGSRSGNARRERWRAGSDGLFPILRLERLVLWRFACQWQRWCRVLYEEKNDNITVFLKLVLKE